ncbi:MAG: hypothetical protein K2J32_04590, partial [Ruminococcus sp.]|nr:hypothetical protein [Ruminococcus sp.]
MQLYEIKEKCIKHYKKIILISVIIIFVVFSNCIIDGKIVCRFATEFTSINVTEKDFNNIQGLYFLKKMSVDCWNVNNVSFLENKNFLKYLSVDSNSIDDWSSLKNCPKLEYFYTDGDVTFHNLKDFSDMENLKNLCIGKLLSTPTIESLDGLQDISKSLEKLTLNGIKNETFLNLEKFSNLKNLDVQNSSLNALQVNSYLENLNISNNPYLKNVYLPADYGTPENIITDNSPYVNII